MRRFAFRVAYDGTDFRGWQRQPDLPTIQASLEAAASDFFGVDTAVDGASRTDAGVHAWDQLAATTFDHKVRPSGFVKAMNKRLGESIAIREAREVELDFAPRFAARGKVYLYRIYISRSRLPPLDRYAWRRPWALDLGAMRAASDHLLGEHDFESFAASDGQHKTSVRRLTCFEFSEARYGVIEIRVSGNAFLKHMVRNLVGTLVDVGRGHRSVDWVQQVLAAKNRSAAGPTAAARGLCLETLSEADDGADREVPVQGG